MIVELSSVGRVPKAITTSFSPDEIDLEDEGRLTSDVALDGNISADDRGVHLIGKIKGNVELACSRCLESQSDELDIEFEDIFVDAAKEPTDDEVEIAGEALDESLVEGGSVDLTDVVREQIILALPERFLCEEDCKGLCPKCGGNRNLIDCSCESRDIDPRWAALKNLN